MPMALSSGTGWFIGANMPIHVAPTMPSRWSGPYSAVETSATGGINERSFPRVSGSVE